MFAVRSQGCLRYPPIVGVSTIVHNDRGHNMHLPPAESASMCEPIPGRAWQFRRCRGAGFLKSRASSVDQACMASKRSTRKTTDRASRRVRSKVTGKKRQRRRRRLTDKIRAALARAASLGRRDVTERRRDRRGSAHGQDRGAS